MTDLGPERGSHQGPVQAAEVLTFVFFSFLDWKSVATHLPFARTPSSPAEEEKLIEILEELAQRFK